MMTMMTYSKKKKEYLASACVRGKIHVKEKLPNQDSILTASNKYGVIMSVADGLGSHRFSKKGSKAAVRAVKKSFMMFEKGKISFKEITATIFKLFKENVKESQRAEASTTCVFAVLSYKHGLFVGQIGDGMCYIRINGEEVLLKKKDDEFTNIVTPLNPSKNEARWKTKHFNINEEDSIEILLATDGISEDIVPGKEGECIEYYLGEIKKYARIFFNFILRRFILNWDVPGSGDDKSIIIFQKE